MELSIDTASDWASVGLSREGQVLAETTWYCRRRHSTQLLPMIDGLMARLGIDKSELTAVFVCTGPGSYAALRVGVSAAKGLAFALALPIVGIGRLELEAYQYAECGRRICALHRAGRGEVAWAVYEGPRANWREASSPRISPVSEAVAHLPAGALLCGEPDDDLTSLLSAAAKSDVDVTPTRRRAGYLAEMAWRRLSQGKSDDVRSLAPMYLREPAIGPQPSG